MKRSELKKYIEENITEILNEASPEELKQKQLTITNRTADIAELNKQISLEKDPKKQAELKAKLAVLKAELAQAQAIKEAKDEDKEVEDFYAKKPTAGNAPSWGLNSKTMKENGVIGCGNGSCGDVKKSDYIMCQACSTSYKLQAT